MAPLPPRLHVVVGTSLLGASLSLGCTAKPDEKKQDNTEKKAPEPDTVNVGPQDPEPVHINTGPIEEPPTKTANPGPQDEPPVAEKPPEPAPVEEKRVNIRPTEI
jgi:hypothetical protein